MHAAPEPPRRGAPLPDGLSAEAPQRDLRWVMHGALALIGVLMALACWSAWRGEQRRSTDAELIQLAGAQSTLSQRVALMAGSSSSDSLAALDTALVRAQGEALRIETLLDAYDDTRLQLLPPALTAAVRRWQDTRERLWYRAQNLARSGAEAGGTTGGLPRPLQAESEQALEAADALVQQIQVHASHKSAEAMQRLGTAAVLGALLLLGLAVALVEPMARRLRRQHARLAAQAGQMARLALVAERTHNAVVITDAQRRIVWANDAFTRVTGHALADAIGQSPGALLQTEGTDPATVARMQAAFAQGRGVRVELLNRGKDGRSYWVDIDIQPLHDASGAVSGFIAVETEITEQVYQRQRLRALLDALPTGVVEHDAHGAIVDANRAAEQVLGLSRDQLCGRTSVDERWRTVHDDLSPYPGTEHPSARSLRDGASVRGESIGVVTPDGEQRWLLVNSEPLRTPTGAVHGAVACFVDVTEQRAQRTLLQMALRAAAIGTWEWRPDTGQRQWSVASCLMLGYQPDEMQLLLPRWREQIHPDDRPVAEERLRAHMDDAALPFRCDLRVRHRAGHWVWLQSYGSVVERDATGRAQRLVGVHIDISERKHHEQQLQASATHDALTGLPNRAALMPALQQAVARWRADPARHFALMFLDFDRFKQVNDTLGHAAGDALLRQIAERLLGALRDAGPGRLADTLVRGAADSPVTAARLGGDEFVVLLTDLRDPADAGAVADRLLQVLARPYALRGQRLHSSASIGVVTSAQPVTDADTLLRDADTAMYEAKRGGRGRWVLFEPRMQAQVAQRATLEADLHEALVRDELFVVYQPVLGLDGAGTSPGCAGVEALVRWRHPDRGLVSPGQFIGVAEETGLIGALGLFVLRTACGQFMRWRLDLGPQAPGLLAVNLSVAQLCQPDLVEQVRQVLADCAMPPACLQLEVTESLAAQDPASLGRLRALKALGVGLALDDFGTGYSSLSCLHQLPVDTVKIDRSFVMEAERSEYHRALIEATVRVARTLRMATVAEGIETAAQSAMVQSLGCDLGQGYLHCRPLEAEALTPWLAARAPVRRGAHPPPLLLVSGG
jgi:diguanylate cyclase (GGDEF)-like protein/PAS domain S-box-containing protein